MTSGTNVPAPTFGPNGFTSPTQSAILAGRQADYQAAFGGTLNFTTTGGSSTNATPQGQLTASDAAIIGNADATFQYFTTQVDPSYAVGRMQDAIARIYFLTRIPAEPTVLQIECVGSGAPIPNGIAGATIIDTGTGNIYTCTEAGTLPPGGGTITLSFAANIPGPLAVPATDGIAIYQAIPGWDTVSVASGVVGNNTETPSEFETRRAQSVAKNSQGMVASVLGNVLEVAGVIDAYAIENATNAPVTNGSGNAAYTLAANSIYVAATGGEESDIALAIFQKKAPGCSYNGNTSQAVQDPNPVYGGSGPTYTVLFETPPGLQILFSVVFQDSVSIPSNATALVQQALLNAFAGLDGGPRARIGSTILATRFIAPILALGSWAAQNLISLDIGSANTAAAQVTGSISGTTFSISATASGSIVIGQTLCDNTGHILPGTIVLSGSGSSWVVNQTQTVASETIFGCLPNQNSVGAGIAQQPSLSALNIAVTT